MTTQKTLNINIKPSSLLDFCQKQLAQSQDIGITHNALLTLKSFIADFSQSQQTTDEYRAIESLLNTITDKSRQSLLKKNSDSLTQALRQCNIGTLTAIHASSPGDDFYNVLRNSISQLSDDDIRLAMLWSENWVKEARELANKTSEMPGEIDLLKASIRLEEFNAISIIDRTLNPK